MASLLAALFAMLLQVALAGAHRPTSEDAAFALKLALGIDAPVCGQPRSDSKTDDRPCHEVCPLCQFAAQAVTLVASPPAIPELRLSAPLLLRSVRAQEAPLRKPDAFAEARGPPSKV